MARWRCCYRRGGAAIWLTRSITVPIGQALAVAQTVAQGDLSSRIEVSSRDETGRLLAALKAMTAEPRIVGTVRSGRDSIATARHRSPGQRTI